MFYGHCLVKTGNEIQVRATGLLSNRPSGFGMDLKLRESEMCVNEMHILDMGIKAEITLFASI